VPKDCPKCMTTNVIQAKTCTKCGATFGGGNEGAAAGCLLLIGLVVVVSIAVAVFGGGSDGGDASEPRDAAEVSSTEDLSLEAFDICKEFVKDRLKSPSSAVFRNYFQDDGEVVVTGRGTGPYTVRSTVDSDNSFGASLRLPFTCRVSRVDDGWHLDDLVLDE
jgi:hypothetical protein